MLNLYSSKSEAIKRYRKTSQLTERWKYKLYPDGTIVDMRTYKVIGFIDDKIRIYELLDMHPATFQKEIRIELNIL